MHCGNPIIDNQKKVQAYHEQFKSTFDVGLNPFMDPVLGFDLKQLRKYLGVPKGDSLKVFLFDKYGGDAVQLIEDIILH